MLFWSEPLAGSYPITWRVKAAEDSENRQTLASSLGPSCARSPARSSPAPPPHRLRAFAVNPAYNSLRFRSDFYSNSIFSEDYILYNHSSTSCPRIFVLPYFFHSTYYIFNICCLSSPIPSWEIYFFLFCFPKPRNSKNIGHTWEDYISLLNSNGHSKNYKTFLLISLNKQKNLSRRKN